MFDLSAPELLIFLVIVVVVFGPGRPAKTMGEIGKVISSFKNSISSEEKPVSVSETRATTK
jgi:sec-independent protein translocase protein TatA